VVGLKAHEESPKGRVIVARGDSNMNQN